MKNYIKVLPLEFPFNQSKCFWQECVEPANQIAPIFNRNGFYYNRQLKMAWLEINREAWKYGADTFLYELEHSEGNNRIEPYIYDALQILAKARLITWRCNKNLWKQMQIEYQMRRLREVTVPAAISGMALRKKLKKSKKNRK